MTLFHDIEFTQMSRTFDYTYEEHMVNGSQSLKRWGLFKYRLDLWMVVFH